MTDTVKLREIIDSQGIKYKVLASKLGLSAYGFMKKVNNEIEFKPSEIVELCKLIHIDDICVRDSIFFAN